MTNLTKLAKSRIQFVKLVNFAIQIFACQFCQFCQFKKKFDFS